MGREWDAVEVGPFTESWGKEVFRVLKPGAHLLSFGGTRTYHRMTCALEDVGFEIRDCLMWLYGSGFPKSLDVSKAIDKHLKVERKVIGEVETPWKTDNIGKGVSLQSSVQEDFTDHNENGYRTTQITEPATPEAEKWQGWGTALKPAYEPIVLARKPLIGTVAQNVLKHGTGGINVDGCRIETADNLNGGAYQERDDKTGAGKFYEGGWNHLPKFEAPEGRWPSNLILSPESAKMLDEQSGELEGPWGKDGPGVNYRQKLPRPSCSICHGTGIIEGVKEHQLGLEKTPEEYVQHLVEVFREVKRVLRDDGTVWLNLGDSYATNTGGGGPSDKQESNEGSWTTGRRNNVVSSLKPKDLVGIPWRVVFALQADGWYLRSDIIWNKPNPMPESVTDRPTKSHEYIFLLTKSSTYFYDQEAIREANLPGSGQQGARQKAIMTSGKLVVRDMNDRIGCNPSGRNKRSVWTMNTKPFSGAHFAVFPPELPETCIKAGTSQKGCCPKCGAPWRRVTEKPDMSQRPLRIEAKQDGERIHSGFDGYPQSAGQAYQNWRNDNPDKTVGWQPTCECSELEPIPCTVLDPFAGSGTTGMVAKKLGRSAILIELNPIYIDLIGIRTGVGVQSGPMDQFSEEVISESDTQ
jgi:DNA modification methylase